MKRNTLVFLSVGILMAMGLLATACKNEETLVPIENTKNIESSDGNNSISFENVQQLVNTVHPQTRATGENEYVFITDKESGDTLFFVVNYPEGGWTMYASDKRVPAVVAENKKGVFDLKEIEEVMADWFEAMKEDMKNVKKAEDKDLNFTPEEIEHHITHWDAICNADAFVRSHLEKSRGKSLVTRSSNGHYELVRQENYEIVYDSVNHLASTKWHQHYPYNAYCPQKTHITNPNDPKAPAGCTAIAAAQMLYFLHYKLGIPAYIPDSAYCNGNINSYTWNQYIINHNIWDLLSDDGNSYDRIHAAPLIANVGKLVGMDYGNNESTSDFDDLVSDVFNNYGIACNSVSYNTALLFSSLQNRMPVIAKAKKKRVLGNAHAFLIDGYKRTQKVTKFIYEWVPESSGGSPVITPVQPPILVDSISYVYHAPEIKMIKMNWGAGDGTIDGNTGNPINETWSSPTGSWLIKVDGENINYLYHRRIIYNFRALEQ